MKIGHLSFGATIMRFYLMMAIVIGTFLINAPYLAIFALPVFLSALMGIKFDIKETGRAMPRSFNLSVPKLNTKKTAA